MIVDGSVRKTHIKRSVTVYGLLTLPLHRRTVYQTRSLLSGMSLRIWTYGKEYRTQFM